ncbi:uncharacterized protein [Primulina eburnea]|uniref:uncharacterized protein isoform X2 n=1 Tax=Primulina eburnea TaxID=1245227 RepID=UPI003C6BDD4A
MSHQRLEKQREFYKNAKHLRKFKKSLKQLEQENVPSTTIKPFEGGNEAEEGNNVNRQKKKNTRAQSLQQLYEQKRGEDEKAKAERDAVIQVRKQEIQQVEARRRALKEKMYKKTKSGQPVMKYRIEHLLETIQGSTS